MRRRLAVLAALFSMSPFVARAVLINEVMSNPGVFDWNADGIGDDAGDEFVEIVNPAAGAPIDLSDWTLSDMVGVRHILAAGTSLPPGNSIAVIANGTPAPIPGFAVAASTHMLGLNNSAGDEIELRYGNLIVSSVSHLNQTPDVSWNRMPEPIGATIRRAVGAWLARPLCSLRQRRAAPVAPSLVVQVRALASRQKCSPMSAFTAATSAYGAPWTQ